jgi:hypothetical protein
MANQSKSITITRGQFGQFGSFIGGVGLLIGALGFIWQGGITPYIALLLGIGIVGMLLWAVMTPDDFRAFFTGRQARQSTLAIFSTLLMIGVVSLTYIIVQRENIVADATVDGLFSLSDASFNVLRAAERTSQKIEITGFYYPNQLVQREVDDSYFQLYVAETKGHIYTRYVNPIEEPGFSNRYMDAIQQGYNVFISFVDDNGDIIPMTTIPVQMTGTQESDITRALSQLLVAGSYKIYFETGLETPDPISNAANGLSVANNYLRANGFITEPLNLPGIAAAGGSIPQDASALIIAQPRRRLNDAEIAVLDRYLQSGGALYIGADTFFSDTVFMGNDDPFNQYLWDNYGLRMTEYIVVDPASSGQTELDVLSAAVFGENSIAANINQEGDPNSATQFRLARAIEVNDNPPVTNGRVIMSSEAAWGETDFVALSTRNEYQFDAAADLRGPLTLVAWARDEATNAKIILIGDGEFMTNGQIIAPEGNLFLLLDGIGWMTGFTEKVEFTPRGYLVTPVLFVGGEQLDIIAFITIILMPGVMFIAAVAVYLRRLRQ